MYTAPDTTPNHPSTPAAKPLSGPLLERISTAPLPVRKDLPSTHASRPGRPTILLVDDEPALLTVGSAILSTLDLNIITARSGEEALICAAGGDLPGLILLDLAMPGGMSGLEAFDALHEKYSHIPIIACSGFFGDGAEEMCQHLGFAGMLPKPYTADSLVSVVRRVLMQQPD
jgi:CheY-like chemotaxis protein